MPGSLERWGDRRHQELTHQHAEALATGLGVTLFDACAFRAGDAKARERWFLPRDRHLSAAGHALLADALYPVLAQELAR